MPVVRYNRLTRWFHTGTYLLTLALLYTGWWLYSGHEGEPSVLADLFGQPDTDLHRNTGYVFLGLAGVGLVVGIRAAWTFVRETLRADRGDGRWLLSWPRGALTGRFASHRGHFDPGQRLANVAFVATFAVLVVTGVALTRLHGGDTFATMLRLHRAATWVLLALVVGHVLLALGLLPGYRGVWRGMHFGGRVPQATVRRLWPTRAGPDPAANGNGAGDGDGDDSDDDVVSGPAARA
jgi:cytochrome b subunit of formate dehydrogenase